MKNIFQGDDFGDVLQTEFNLNFATEEICATCSTQLLSPSLSDPCNICADGSYEVIIYSDRPGGLGSFKPK